MVSRLPRWTASSPRMRVVHAFYRAIPSRVLELAGRHSSLMQGALAQASVDHLINAERNQNTAHQAHTLLRRALAPHASPRDTAQGYSSTAQHCPAASTYCYELLRA